MIRKKKIEIVSISFLLNQKHTNLIIMRNYKLF